LQYIQIRIAGLGNSYGAGKSLQFTYTFAFQHNIPLILQKLSTDNKFIRRLQYFTRIALSFTEYRCFDYNPNLATERSMPPQLAGSGEDGVTVIKPRGRPAYSCAGFYERLFQKFAFRVSRARCGTK
jgi:hypothetical protein